MGARGWGAAGGGGGGGGRKRRRRGPPSQCRVPVGVRSLNAETTGTMS